MELVQEAGVFGWAVIGLGVSALALSFFAAASASPKLALAAALDASTVMLMGAVGTLLTRAEVARALESVEPGVTKNSLLRQGHLEASASSSLALLIGALPLALALVAALRFRARQAEQVRANDELVWWLPLALVCVGILFAAGNLALRAQPLPGIALTPEQEQLARILEGHPEDRCQLLADTLRRQPSTPEDLAQLRKLKDPTPVATECLELGKLGNEREEPLWALLDPRERARIVDARAATADTAIRNAALTGRPFPEADPKRVIAQGLKAFQHCYEVALKKNPSAGGTFELLLDVAPTGAIESASRTGGTLKNDDVEGCILSSARELKFAPSVEGFTLKQPMSFAPATP